MILTAIIGSTTGRSLSVILYNFFALKHNLEYSHIKISIKPKTDNLKKTIKILKIFNFKGINITLPYKIEVIQYLDKIEKEALETEAVNTVLNNNNKLIGFNTDGYGGIKAIENKINRQINKRDKILIFGSGGAARALVYQLLKKTKQIQLVYREPTSLSTKRLVTKYNSIIQMLPYNRSGLYKQIIESNIICNATNVGMWPNIHSSILSHKDILLASKFSNYSKKLFFDVISYPSDTLFLRQAKKLGAKTQNGLEMMIYQGVLSFKIWTNIEIKQNVIASVRKRLKKAMLQILNN